MYSGSPVNSSIGRRQFLPVSAGFLAGPVFASSAATLAVRYPVWIHTGDSIAGKAAEAYNN